MARLDRWFYIGLGLWAFGAVVTEAHFAAGNAEGAEVSFIGSAMAAAMAFFYAQKENPRMSKGRTRFKLAELRQKHAETVGDTIEIETEDGSVFAFPAPGFWPDQAKEAFANSNDVLGVKELIGVVEYLKFKQAGGRADDVALALKEFAAEQGISVGESSASPMS